MSWPVNLVLQPAMLDAYDRILRFLLQLKAAKLKVERVDMELRAQRQRRLVQLRHDDVVHRLLCARHRLYLFLATLNNYSALQLAASGCSWARLTADIGRASTREGRCVGLDEICAQHGRLVAHTLQSLFLPREEGEPDAIWAHMVQLLGCADELQRVWRAQVRRYLECKAQLEGVKASSRFQHEKNKLFRLEEEALRSVSLLHAKFERLYRFCLVTIDKIKNKSLSHSAINAVAHLDFNHFYERLFEL